MSVNKVILVGNVGKDPEIRYLDENTAVCKFPLATSESYKNRDGERVEQTEWHNIVLWRGLAQIAEKYIKKGSQLYLEGRIKTRSYDDRDGVKKYITEIVGDNMQMLGRKSDDAGAAMGGASSGTQMPESDAPSANSQPSQTNSQPSANSQPSQSADSASGVDEADDLPF